MIALQDRLGWYERDDEQAVTGQWETLCDILREAPTEREMRELVRRIGLDYDEFTALYGDRKLNDAVRYAKDLKDRYSVLWLYHQYA